MEERLFTVGELAGELAVTARALRFYEDRGLLQPRRVGQNRVYGRRDRARLILILRGKRLGFSLAEIRDWLDLYDADPLQVAQTRHLARQVDARLRRLEQQRDDLEATIGVLRDITGQIALHRGEAATAGSPARERRASA